MNCVHFQLAMLAYNLNCWLMPFNREEQAKTEHCTTRHWRQRAFDSCFGGQDWAPRRHSPGAVQRSLRRARNDVAVNVSAAFDRAEWQSFRPRPGDGAPALNDQRA